jgi:hypothetical protein
MKQPLARAGPEVLPAESESLTIADMEQSEIDEIRAFLSDVYEGICEDDGPTALRLYLDKLYATIKLLMDETFKTKDQELKVILASLEYNARRCKQIIEERLAVRN